MSKSAYLSLKPATRQFVDNYIDPTSETYNNGMRSMLAARQNQIQPDSAAVEASKLLRTDKVRNAIEEILALNGAAENVRLQILAGVSLGNYQKETVTEYMDPDGNVQSQIRVKTSPSAADIVRANNLIWKATGKYDVNRAAANALSARTKQLMRKFDPAKQRKARHGPS